ncbi:MAG TPA: DUF2934 domain-containing protein [Nitrospira sp.]|nr:DUF2934 domain-containing protein [Nitrospira sp.]
MARQTNGEPREANTNGRRALVAKVGRTFDSRRASQRAASSVGHESGGSAAQAEWHDRLHQEIAERAFFLYEQSGFQDGNDLEHWLEAERQIKGVRGQAA